MNVFNIENAAVAQAALSGIEGEGARLEAAAQAAGYLDAEGFFTMTDEEFQADLRCSNSESADLPASDALVLPLLAA
jgi:hypothetical protein